MHIDSQSTYNAHADREYGPTYARTVGRFQEGFIADKAFRKQHGIDALEVAFDRAVETCDRLIEVIKTQHAATREGV